MQELIERLGKATGPDRELDFELHLARGLKASKSRRRDGQGSWWVYDAYDDGGYGLQSLPRYTGSIDESLMLLPAAWRAQIDTLNWVEVLPIAIGVYQDARREMPIHIRHNKMPAIALCIASIKARAQLTLAAA